MNNRCDYRNVMSLRRCVKPGGHFGPHRLGAADEVRPICTCDIPYEQAPYPCEIHANRGIVEEMNDEQALLDAELARLQQEPLDVALVKAVGGTFKRHAPVVCGIRVVMED